MDKKSIAQKENSIRLTSDLILVKTESRLELRVTGGEDNTIIEGNPVYIDWQKLDTTSSFGRRLKQPISKACGIKKGNKFRPNILDTTAGFGEDGWLLAALGCKVTMIERDSVIVKLLDDALKRAKLIAPDIASRIELIHDNSIDYLKNLKNKINNIDVIYVDPMFPARRKGAQKKKMKVLRMLAGNDVDSTNLFNTALSTGLRVVVKRPLKAQAISNIAPIAIYKGKGYRFDVYKSSVNRG